MARRGREKWNVAPGPDGKRYWVDGTGLVQGVVKTGKPQADAQEYAECRKVRELLNHWGWPKNSIVERPKAATYDYDCIRPDTGERAAVEVKEVSPPQKAMNDFAAKNKGRGAFTVREFQALLAKRLAKANEQLAGAPPGARRCVILVSPYEPVNCLKRMWDWIVEAVAQLDRASYPNVDEVWLVSPHLTSFQRLW